MKRWAVLCAVLALVVAGQSHAQQCGFARCWGAVGVGPDGARGYAHGQYSEALAHRQVQAICDDNCDTVQTFYNGCGAMAQGPSGQWGFGESYSRIEAQDVALAFCEGYGASCEVRAWACSP
ncbi:DUF4189 domain-containing protein [Shimia sp. MMG029]|uniref:DUF4189 domain-containing protein n=1 Tax=Shimia sp. MMG029 TaxID=3021978 RepID=UPI0022FE7192|nr:DUF4189 domain-containing protein [Shimia sp. MMG029]MDA5557457.1 DUF4189 domain-containing protein [Shimia sp. MMG029]